MFNEFVYIDSCIILYLGFRIDSLNITQCLKVYSEEITKTIKLDVCNKLISLKVDKDLAKTKILFTNYKIFNNFTILYLTKIFID